MSYFIGRQFSVGIGKEGTRGTATAATYWFSDATITLDDTIKAAKNTNSLGRIEEGAGQEIATKQAKLELEANVSDISFGAILMALMGTDTPELVDGETLVYDHVFTVAQSAQHPSYTISAVGPNEGASGLAYPLGMLDSLDIKFELGKYTSYKAAFKMNTNAAQVNTQGILTENLFKPLAISFSYGASIGATIGAAVQTVGTGLSDLTSGGTYTQKVDNVYTIKISATGTPDYFEVSKNGGSFGSPIAITGAAQTVADGITVLFAATTGHTSGDEWTITATYGEITPTAINCTNISLSFKKNTEDYEVFGTESAIDRFNKQFSCTGSYELKYNNRTFIDTVMLGDEYVSFQVVLQNSAVTIGSASNPTITINFAKTKLTEVSRKISINDVVSQSIKFMPFYSPAAGEMLDITLRNLQSSAY